MILKGLAPSIAIQQKVISSNPRSTVGTTTEIYDYLKLLFARVGRTYSPVSGEEVRKDSVTDVIDFIKAQKKHLHLFYVHHGIMKPKILQNSLRL